jgi:hypothetical protein
MLEGNDEHNYQLVRSDFFRHSHLNVMSWTQIANPGDDPMICYSFWNTKNVVRPILGAVAKRFDEVKYVDILNTNLTQFATSVMDPCLIPCCRSDITCAVW